MATLVEVPEVRPAKKKLVRRVERDRSQITRAIVQYAFVALNGWIGVQFYLFVRYCETGGVTPHVSRPAGVEGWLPIASLMNLKYFVLTRHMPASLCAGMLLLIVFLLSSLLLRKAFCSWLCPVGTLSEVLWKLGRKLIGRSLMLPRWLDLPLRSLKYLLMAFFLFAVGTMSAGAIEQFLSGPYGAVADVQMLNFFRHLGSTAAVVLIVLAALSLFLQNFWCRYLCPYGALMGLVAVFSPVKIVRSEEPCIDCGKCAKACPAQLPVDRLVTIRSAECMNCMECVAVCPAEGALELKAARKIVLRPLHVAIALTVLFLGMVTYGKLSGHWESAVPQSTYMDWVGHANEALHP